MKYKTIRKCEFTDRQTNGLIIIGCALVKTESGRYATFHYDRAEGSEDMSEHWWNFPDDWEGALNEYTAMRERLIEALDMAAERG